MRKALLGLIVLFSLVANAQFTYVQPTLLYGPVDANHIKVIITAEGYTQAQASDFSSRAYAAAEALMTLQPFSQNLSKIGYYSHFIPSAEEGIGIWGQERNFPLPDIPNVVKNTTYGFRYNAEETLRLIGTDNSTRADMETYFSQFDTVHDKIFIIVLCNADEYGGSGEFPNEAVQGLSGTRKTSIAVIPDLQEWDGFDNEYQTSQNIVNTFKFLVRHEFAHSFGNLDDEYVDSNYASIFYPTTIPNKKNIKDNKTGLFASDKFEHEGGRYLSTGKWRRAQNDIMRGSPTVSGSAPYKVSVYPEFFDGNTDDDIEDALYSYIYPSNSSPAEMAQYGRGTSADACYMAGFVTRYTTWNGIPYAQYIVGNYIYTNPELTNKFNGANQWFKTSVPGIHIKIGSDGRINQISGC